MIQTYTQTLHSLFAYFASRDHSISKIHMLEMCDYTRIPCMILGMCIFSLAIGSFFN